MATKKAKKTSKEIITPCSYCGSVHTSCNTLWRCRKCNSKPYKICKECWEKLLGEDFKEKTHLCYEHAPIEIKKLFPQQIKKFVPLIHTKSIIGEILKQK